jgi:hypothetical protein
MESRLFLRHLSLLLSILLTVVSAQIEFVAPQAGSIRKGGSTITVEWRYSVGQSELYDFARYDIFLCAGGNSEESYVRRSSPLKPSHPSAISRSNLR